MSSTDSPLYVPMPEGSSTPPPLPPVGFCRTCGKPLDSQSVRRLEGTLFCAEHAPAQPSSPSSPYTQATPPPINVSSDVSPGVAFVLGMIPGVGAIYNGQYAKGLVHVMIVGLLISILDRGDARSLEPLLGMMLAAFWAYMAFEAHHTARQRQRGMVADEFSSIFPMKGASRFPVAPVLLIALGVIFLLDNLGLLAFDRVFRYWPVLMIGLGIYMLYSRLAGNSGDKQ